LYHGPPGVYTRSAFKISLDSHLKIWDRKSPDKYYKPTAHFVGFAGASHKYNQTLTVAAIKARKPFFRRSTSNTFNDFIAEFPQLQNRFKELMQFHYTTDIFTSEKAKGILSNG
jgi:hypothetical protein